jgi:cell division protein FtsX
MTTALREPGAGASIGALFGVLFLVQVIILFTVGIHASLRLLSDRNDVRLEILPAATLTDIAKLRNDLRGQPYVDDVVYVTREQAYEHQRQRDPELIRFLEEFHIQNPFPETIAVRIKHLQDFRLLTQFLQQSIYAATINPNFLSHTTDQQDQVEKLLAATETLRSFLLLIVVLVTLVLLFVIIELVGRRALLRSEEILVQQLVGATTFTILLPFSIEVLCLMFLALILSFTLIGFALYGIPIVLPSFAAGGLFAQWVEVFWQTLITLLPWMMLMEVIVLPLLAVGGAFFGLWSRLHRPTLSSSRV